MEPPNQFAWTGIERFARVGYRQTAVILLGWRQFGYPELPEQNLGHHKQSANYSIRGREIEHAATAKLPRVSLATKLETALHNVCDWNKACRSAAGFQHCLQRAPPPPAPLEFAVYSAIAFTK
jgi:hypothetical protein